MQSFSRTAMRAARPRKVLAVASTGGHWIQLRMMAEAWVDQETVYVCSGAERSQEVAPARCHTVPDVSRTDRLGVLRLAWRLIAILASERPDVIVSTGAAAGGLAVALGRLFGARTVWIDSVANAEQLSGSGRLARRFASLSLTQWPHLARPDGPHYLGGVL